MAFGILATLSERAMPFAATDDHIVPTVYQAVFVGRSLLMSRVGSRCQYVELFDWVCALPVNDDLRYGPTMKHHNGRESELPTSIMLDVVLILMGYAEAGLPVLPSVNQGFAPLVMVKKIQNSCIRRKTI